MDVAKNGVFWIGKKKKKSKIGVKNKIFLKKVATYKTTLIEGQVQEKLQKKIFSLKFSHKAVNNWLNKKPRKQRIAKTRFLLRNKDKKGWKNFAKRFEKKK